MIINDSYEIRPDKLGWILVYHQPNDTSRGNTKNKTREIHTYYGSVEQAAKVMLSKSGQDCETAQELIEEWDRAVEDIKKACEVFKDIKLEEYKKITGEG